VVSVIFVPLGVWFLITSNRVQEYEMQYDTICGPPNITEPVVCSVNFENVAMKPPIYMYYKLSNYYQNHRRYVKSRSDDQLRGKIITSSSALSDCSPLRNIGPTFNSSTALLPCGLIVWSLFNDTYVVRNTATGDYVPLQKEGIAWESDVKEKFKNPPPSDQVRVIADFEDEDFIVWMRVAGLPTFKKLWRIINVPMNGNYTVTIRNNYPVSEFGGKKYVVLSETSWLGGKNPFLGYAYIVVGCVCLFQAFVFFLKHKISGRAPGDTSYLAWNK